MDTGLLVTVGVFGLVALFGLIIFRDQKRTKREEGVAAIPPKNKMTPEEFWQKHVEELRKSDT